MFSVWRKHMKRGGTGATDRVQSGDMDEISEKVTGSEKVREREAEVV